MRQPLFLNQALSAACVLLTLGKDLVDRCLMIVDVTAEVRLAVGGNEVIVIRFAGIESRQDRTVTGVSNGSGHKSVHLI